MTTRFDTDTAVERVSEDRFEARIDAGWWILSGPNGGYIAAILLRALGLAVGDASRRPRSLTIHYTAPPAEGAARIETRVERTGRSLTSVSARLLQEERPIALALAAFSKPRNRGVELAHARMPEVPPPERCPSFAPLIPIHERYELRWAVGPLPFSRGDQALCGGWIRLAEPRLLDPLLAAAFADGFPPAIFSTLALEQAGIVIPTVDLTVHFRASLPREGATPLDYTLALFRTREAREGFLEEDGELWSRDGTLLAQSRQLALAR